MSNDVINNVKSIQDDVLLETYVNYLQLDFGNYYYGESVSKSIEVYNNGPVDIRYYLSLTTASQTKQRKHSSTPNDS